MIDGEKPVPSDLPPGPERRALMRRLELRIGTDDFSEQEWADIEAEAPGTRQAIESGFEDTRRPGTA